MQQHAPNLAAARTRVHHCVRLQPPLHPVAASITYATQVQQNKGDGKLSLTLTRTLTRTLTPTLTQVQQNKGEGKPPLAGAGLLLMGGMFMYVGSGLYVYQVFKLASNPNPSPRPATLTL